MTGFNEVMGSWKTIAISLPHTRRISFTARLLISTPWKRTVPERITLCAGKRPMIDRAKTRQADLLLMVAAPVQQLVEAGAGQAQHN